MFYPPELLSWGEQVSSHLPHLSKRQAQVLAWYSFAVTVVQRCGISHVAYFLASLLNQDENSIRQRLRESLYEAEQKRGRQRRQLNVAPCFAPLLKWVLSVWQSEDQVLCLALDATSLRQTFTVLSVSLLVGRCAIPLAWIVLPATQPGSWKPYWQQLLAHVCVPTPDLCVLVAADRGLYAKWLFEAIVACGWHPLLRINAQGSCCVQASGQRIALATLASLCKNHCWHGAVICFADGSRLPCTLLAMWDEAQHQAWLVVTDLPADHVSPTWYSLRMWIEAGFKALKSAGFHWEATRMTDPARAQRLWLILALASLRLLTLAPPTAFALGLSPQPPHLSLFKQGCLRQLAALILARPFLPSPLFMQPLPPAPCLEFLNLLKTYP
jgi:hypothetical protein